MKSSFNEIVWSFAVLVVIVAGFCYMVQSDYIEKVVAQNTAYKGELDYVIENLDSLKQARSGWVK